MALKINYLISADTNNTDLIHSIAHKIGASITSPSKLENEITNISRKKILPPSNKSLFKSDDGLNLFTFKTDKFGKPVFIIDKSILDNLDVEKLCSQFKSLILSLKNSTSGPQAK